MANVTMNADYRITIPRLAREALKIRPGDKVDVIVRGPRFMELRKSKQNRVDKRTQTDDIAGVR